MSAIILRLWRLFTNGAPYHVPRDKISRLVLHPIASARGHQAPSLGSASGLIQNDSPSAESRKQQW